MIFEYAHSLSALMKKREIKIVAPAKVNLLLSVGERFPDGYHRVSTVISRLRLADTILLSDNDVGQVRLSSSLDGDLLRQALVTGELGRLEERLSGSANIVWKALDLYRRNTSQLDKHIGLDVHITKRIPLDAGLGGGSADAASVLLALNDRDCGVLSTEGLEEIAAELGADVPCLLHRHPVAGVNRGERVVELAMPGAFCEGLSLVGCLLLKPPQGSSTAAAYRLLNRPVKADMRGVSPGCACASCEKTCAPDLEIIENFKSDFANRWLTLYGDAGSRQHARQLGADFIGIASAVFVNDFQSFLSAEYSWSGMAQAWLADVGAGLVLLCGSGSCYFGFFPSCEDAEVALSALKSLVPEDWFIDRTSFAAANWNLSL